jgi:hypothetical protein
MRFFMMAADWGQHAFINPDSKDASYNCVAFNDGLHASHHENSQRHWSDHPNAAISQADASFTFLKKTPNFTFGFLLQ